MFSDLVEAPPRSSTRKDHLVTAKKLPIGYLVAVFQPYENDPRDADAHFANTIEEANEFLNNALSDEGLPDMERTHEDAEAYTRGYAWRINANGTLDCCKVTSSGWTITPGPARR